MPWIPEYYPNFLVRRVPPHFTIRPEAKYEVKNGASLNITCVAVGSPMPFVKWREGSRDLTPDNELPIGKNVLELENIRDTRNYTCVAASKLGIIETKTVVKVQGISLKVNWFINEFSFILHKNSPSYIEVKSCTPLRFIFIGKMSNVKNW